MHENHFSKMNWFKNSFLSHYMQLNILDIGSLNNIDSDNYKLIFNVPNWNYVGLDIVEGNNVDIVVKDIYNFEEIENDSFDVVVSSYFFEYLKFYWKTMCEIKRILKKGGYVCIIVSSSVNNNRTTQSYNKFQKDDLIKLAYYFDFEVIHFSNFNESLGEFCLVLKDKGSNNHAFKQKLNDLEEKIHYLNSCGFF